MYVHVPRTYYVANMFMATKVTNSYIQVQHYVGGCIWGKYSIMCSIYKTYLFLAVLRFFKIHSIILKL